MALFGFGKKKNKTETVGGDFSSFDSMEKINKAVKQGVLAPMYLVSPLFGGAEDISNTLFVPPAIIIFKDSIDKILEGALNSGKQVKGFSIKPEYKGKSIVPSRIVIQASGDVNIMETINIW